MAKKRKMSDIRRKELQRVRKFIARAEKRGYTFTDEFKASISSKTTRALQMLTPRRLYEKANYQYKGETLVGLAGRRIERELSAIKGKKTKKYLKKLRSLEAEAIKQGIEFSGPHVVDMKKFSEGMLIYQNILDDIDNFPASEGAEYLSNLLKSEISTYGEDRVIAALAEMDEDIIRVAHDVLVYAANSQQIHTALRDFSEAIRSGEAISKEESKKLNDVMESMTGAH